MSSPEREAEAAAMVRECHAALAARGRTVIDEIVGPGGIDIADWRHYPDGEVYDAVNHAQYFYHRHAQRHAPAPRLRSTSAAEHGHFHLFLRGEAMPAGVTPLVLPEIAVANAPTPRQSAPLKRGSREEVCHLVAVAIDRGGQPIRLFTTNRWVTGESWYRAEDVIGMLGRFRVGTDQPSPVLNRWLTGLVRLFQPEIATLLHRRDKAVLERRWRWRNDVLEDPRLEITSSLDIDLEASLALAEQSPRPPAIAAGARSVARLPRMSEGWGA